MLSKSKFTRGINCEKSLWLYFHKYDERYVDEETQSIFNQGTNAGELARQYFPDGKMAVLEEFPGYEAAKRTQDFIREGVQTIYEATFIFENTLVAVDLLTKIKGKWHLFEMKSTNSVKPQHVEDVAVQYYVVTGSGLQLNDASVMFMNRDYIRKGELDIKNLFTHESVISQVLELQNFVRENIAALSVLEKQENEPMIEMGAQCTSPYTCDFCDYCMGLLPEKQEELPAELSNVPEINHSEIESFLKENSYPLYFFDFETIMPCVPMFDNSRPYQQIPFQYSLHYLPEKNGHLEHFEYLAETKGDPRVELIKQLINDTKRPGAILVYNIAFERSRLKEMQRDFPEYEKELQEIIDRLVDLMPVFRKQHYVTESMQGSYSIKKVLPALCPDLNYSTLEINNGGDASAAFLALYDEKDNNIIQKTREDLLKYCEMDTLAMVKIIEVLENR